MDKIIFKKIAEKENGKFYFQDEDRKIGGGVRSPNIIYLVKFEYKENEISILNNTGTSFVGEIKCKFSSTIQPIPFQITSISHLKNLFLRKKSRFVIQTNNENIKHFLKENNSMKELSEIAKKDNFSPSIDCDVTDSREIEMKYHLEFDNWTQVIEPTIELYKNLIDEFEKRIANISPKSYQNIK